MTSTLRFVVALLPFCTPWLAAAAATHTPTVRREQPSGTSLSEVSVHTGGQLSRSHGSHDATTDTSTATDAPTTATSNSETTTDNANSNADTNSGDHGYDDTKRFGCDEELFLGTPGTSECSAATHKMITAEWDCEHAAERAGLSRQDDFLIHPTEYNTRPEGCFKDECTDDASKTCYFFNAPNAQRESPTNIAKGTPVCTGPLHLEGVRLAGAAPAEGVGYCSSMYQEITTKHECYEWAVCLGKSHTQCPPTLLGGFDINRGNASVYNEFPKYCFKHDQDGCIYFNTPRPGFLDPSKPVGTPICNLTASLNFE